VNGTTAPAREGRCPFLDGAIGPPTGLDRLVSPQQELRRLLPYVQIVDEGGRGQRAVGPLRAKSPARDLTQIPVDNGDQPAVRGLVPPDLTPGGRPMSPFWAGLRF